MQDRATGRPRRSTAPGAMTVAMRAVDARLGRGVAGPEGTGAARQLRVGVVHGGRIVAEHRLADGEHLSVGHAAQCDVVLEGTAGPEHAVLLRATADGYHLDTAVADALGARGRLQMDGRSVEVGRRARDDDGWLPLGDDLRGTLRIGGTALLLQFVNVQPDMPRPRLPAAVRGRVTRGIDWLFASMLTFSMMSAFGFFVYLQQMDWPVPGSAAVVPERLARYIFNEPAPPEPADARTPNDAPKAVPAPDATPPPEDAVARRTPKPREPQASPGPRTPTAHTATTPDARASLVRDAAVAAASALVVGALDSAGGALRDVIGGGAVVGNAAEIIARAGAVQMAGARDSLLPARRGPRANGARRPIGELGQRGTRSALHSSNEGQGPTERVIDRIPGRAVVGEGGDIAGAGEFDGARVVAAIKRRIGAIKSCYEQGLRRDPSLAGKLTMRFTVQPGGGVTDARASTDSLGDPSVANCVARKLRGLRFDPGPVGGSVTFAYPFVFAPQG